MFTLKDATLRIATPKEEIAITEGLNGEPGMFTQIYLEVNEAEHQATLSWFVNDFQYEVGFDGKLAFKSLMAMTKNMSDEDFADFVIVCVTINLEAIV